MSETVEAVLRGAGLTDKPGELDSSIHSWRCEHPETYGHCDCLQELVRELAEVERAAAEKAWAEALMFIYANAWVTLDPGVAPVENPYQKEQ